MQRTNFGILERTGWIKKPITEMARQGRRSRKGGRLAREEDAATREERGDAAADGFDEFAGGCHGTFGDEGAGDRHGGQELDIETAMSLNGKARVQKHGAEGSHGKEADVGISPRVSTGRNGATTGFKVAQEEEFGPVSPSGDVGNAREKEPARFENAEDFFRPEFRIYQMFEDLETDGAIERVRFEGEGKVERRDLSFDPNLLGTFDRDIADVDAIEIDAGRDKTCTIARSVAASKIEDFRSSLRERFEPVGKFRIKRVRGFPSGRAGPILVIVCVLKRLVRHVAASREIERRRDWTLCAQDEAGYSVSSGAWGQERLAGRFEGEPAR